MPKLQEQNSRHAIKFSTREFKALQQFIPGDSISVERAQQNIRTFISPDKKLRAQDKKIRKLLFADANKKGQKSNYTMMILLQNLKTNHDFENFLTFMLRDKNRCQFFFQKSGLIPYLLTGQEIDGLSLNASLLLSQEFLNILTSNNNYYIKKIKKADPTRYLIFSKQAIEYLLNQERTEDEMLAYLKVIIKSEQGLNILIESGLFAEALINPSASILGRLLFNPNAAMVKELKENPAWLKLYSQGLSLDQLTQVGALLAQSQSAKELQSWMQRWLEQYVNVDYKVSMLDKIVTQKKSASILQHFRTVLTNPQLLANQNDESLSVKTKNIVLMQQKTNLIVSDAVLIRMFNHPQVDFVKAQAFFCDKRAMQSACGLVDKAQQRFATQYSLNMLRLTLSVVKSIRSKNPLQSLVRLYRQHVGVLINNASFHNLINDALKKASADELNKLEKECSSMEANRLECLSRHGFTTSSLAYVCKTGSPVHQRHNGMDLSSLCASEFKAEQKSSFFAKLIRSN